MNKILITAFMPFGLTGKFLRRANASLDVACVIQSSAHKDCDLLTLPVSAHADDILKEYLERNKPSAILCMGEDFLMPNAVNIEPFAYGTAPTFNFMAAAYAPKIMSTFLEEDQPAPRFSGIGTYYCNSLYKTALLWAKENGNTPTTFAHIAVIGNRDRQSEKLITLIEAMKKRISSEPKETLQP